MKTIPEVKQEIRSYYGCDSPRHTEFTCLTHYYQNRKFTQERWCDSCKTRYDNLLLN